MASPEPKTGDTKAIAQFSIAGIPLTLRKGEQPREYILETPKASADLGLIAPIIIDKLYDELDCECGIIGQQEHYEKVSKTPVQPISGITIQGFPPVTQLDWEPDKGNNLYVYAKDFVMQNQKAIDQEYTMDRPAPRPQLGEEGIRQSINGIQAKLPDRESFLKALEITEKKMTERAYWLAYWNDQLLRKGYDLPPENTAIEKEAEFQIAGFTVRLKRYAGVVNLHMDITGMNSDIGYLYLLLNNALRRKKLDCLCLAEVTNEHGNREFVGLNYDRAKLREPSSEVDFDHLTDNQKYYMRAMDLMDGGIKEFGKSRHIVLVLPPGYSKEQMEAGKKIPTFGDVASILEDLSERYPWQNDLGPAVHRIWNEEEREAENRKTWEQRRRQNRDRSATEPYLSAVEDYLKQQGVDVTQNLKRQISHVLQTTRGQQEYQAVWSIPKSADSGHVGALMGKRTEAAKADTEPYAHAVISVLVDQRLDLKDTNFSALKQVLAEAYMKRTPLQKLVG